jgi:ATP-binding cassette subfamily F protein uup
VEAPVAATTATDTKARKLSFKEKRELELLEKELEALEKEKADIETALSSGELPFDKMEPMTRRIGEIIQLLDEKGMRWLELSEIEG